MKRNILLILIISILFMTQSPAHGDTSYLDTKFDRSFLDSKIIKELSSADLPDQSAVVLLDRLVDKWILTDRTKIIKILTEEGIRYFGDFLSDIYKKKYIDYDLEAWVISPSGAKTKIKENEVKEVKIAEEYYQYRVALPGIEIGSIIEIHEKVKYERREWVRRWDFATSIPTLKSEIIVRVGNGVSLKFYTSEQENWKQHEPIVDGDSDVYLVTMENLPPYIDEKYMSTEHIGNPSIFYRITDFDVPTKGIIRDGRIIITETKKIYRSWQGIGKVFEKFFDKETWKDDPKAEEYGKKVNTVLKEFGLEDVSDMDLELKLGKLKEGFHNYIQPVEDFIMYETENPAECLILREGDAFDLAYTFKLFLDALKVPSSIVVVKDIDRGLMDTRLRDIDQLHHPIILVETFNNKFWIDPYTPESGVNQLPWQCQGVEGLWIKKGEEFKFLRTPMDRADKNVIETSINGDLDKNGDVSGVLNVSITGQYLMGLRSMINLEDIEDGKDELREFLELFLSGTLLMENLEVVNHTKDNLTLKCGYSLEDFASPIERYMNIDCSVWGNNPLMPIFESEKRKYDIVFPFPFITKTKVVLNCVEDFEMVELPFEIQKGNDSFEYVRNFTRRGKRLIFQRMFRLSKPSIEAATYPKAKEFIELVQKYDSEAAIMKIE